jgi:RNA polymerase sigma-70 factor (sigma-E family)
MAHAAVPAGESVLTVADSQGDVDDAFAELFAARSAAIRRTAYLLCGNWHRAEDLAQTAFAKLYVAWPRLRDADKIESYLRRTLMHAYIDDSRRAFRRERPTAELPDTPDPQTDSTDDRLVLMAALAQVPARQRACLVLRYFEDCSVAQAADALNCNDGTVKSNTSRGLDTLRQALLGRDDSDFGRHQR